MNPLATTTPETTATLLNFPPPLHLKHHPARMIPYEPFDGRYAGDTDAKYFSVGDAQWRGPHDPYPVSAKVWRYVEGKWSRMSEELPLHRLFDLCLFAATSVFGTTGSNTTVFPAGTFQGQAETMEARQLQPLPAGFADDLLAVKSRLRALRDVLNQLDL